MRWGWARAVAVGIALSVLAASCGNAPPGQFAGAQGSAPGVTPTSIRVGGLASVTGPLGGEFGAAFAGAQAYFDMVNAAGGVDGRKIHMVARLDDQTDPSTDVSQARALLEVHHVFAVVPVASPVFSAGSYLAAQAVPTFGYNINPAQWDTGPNMFGHNGSYLNPAGIDVAGPFLATNLGVSRVAVLGYSVTQSAQCVRGQAKSFTKFGFRVVFTDASLPIGVPSVAPEIAKLQSSGAQLAVLCMDPTGDEKISEGLHQAGLSNVAQFWINGYDEASLAQYRRQYEGVYLAVSYVPFEEASRSPGLTRFLAEMRRRFPSVPVGEVALAGWISADMFVTGLRKAGPHLTRRRLVDAVNSLTDFTAGGIEPPVDWRVDHTSPGPVNCSSFVQVRNGRFTPIFHQPFTCLPQNAATRAQLRNLPNVAGVR